MKKRILSYDLVRVLAILGVVAIHTENITSSPTNYLGGLSWWFANTIHSLIIISVPLFIMLTGALALKKRRLTYTYVYKKIIKQFTIPLIFWWAYYSHWQIELTKFIKTDIGHLYFLQVIIGLYLILPLLHRFLQTTRKNQQYLGLGLITILSISYEYLSFFTFKTFNNNHLLLIFLPFITYLWWGYYLSKLKINTTQWKIIALAALLLTIIISILTYFNTISLNSGLKSYWTPNGGNFFWEPFTIPVLLLSGLVYILLINIEVIFPQIFTHKKINQILLFLSLNSFGIYLIHPFLLNRIDQYFNLSLHLISYPLWSYYLQRTSIVFIISSIFSAILKKIPIIKNIV